MSVEAPPQPMEEAVPEATALKPQIGETMDQFLARQEAANGMNGTTAPESAPVPDAVITPEAEVSASPIPVQEVGAAAEPQPGLGFGKMEQITYKTGAKHVYGVDEAGKKRHLSHDAVLESYGYNASEAVEAKKLAASERAKEDELIAEAAQKATPQMVKTAQAMLGAEKDTAKPEEAFSEGTYGMKGSELVNHGIDIVAAPSKELAPTDLPGYGYDGPVRKGMELERASGTDLAVPAAEANLPVPAASTEIVPATADQAPDNLPAIPEATADATEVLDENDKPGLFRRAKNAIMLAPAKLLQKIGGMMERDSNDEEKQKRGRRALLIGAGALAGAGVLAYANNKYGWGIDIDPRDGGIDLNPFNNAEQADTVAGGTPVPFEGTETASPEMTSVHIDAGEGTSHIARDNLGINFDTVEQWDRFNAATNPLFEGLDGVYKDAASGEWRIANPGEFQIPQEILDEMQRTAEQIKTAG